METFDFLSFTPQNVRIGPRMSRWRLEILGIYGCGGVGVGI
jgi:hypothetical protein